MLHVYIDKISNYTVGLDVYPKGRLLEILSCKSEKVKTQKYASWKLLENALKSSLNLRIEDCEFFKLDNGKWVASGVYFSISHSDDFVCVAISNSSVGVDIEKVKTIDDNLDKKILTETELETYKKLDKIEKNNFLLTAWTGKESVYKKLDSKTFNPSKIELADYSVKSYNLSVDKSEFLLSVCSEKINVIYFQNNVKNLYIKN